MSPARRALVVAAAGVVLAVLGLVLQPGALPHALLAALALLCAWPVGSLLLLFSHALTGGQWGRAIRPGLLAGMPALLLVPVAFALVAVFLPSLYPWARPDGAALPNRAWLNVPFFAGRAVLYLLCWLGLGLLALRTARPGFWAPAALAALALTWTFGSVDLVLSLDPRFTSSVFGMLSLAGAGVLALSVSILLSPGTQASDNDDLGRLLLALSVLWAYLDFMQLLIVWQSDLVRQVPWYAARMFGWGGAAAVLVALTHTVIPFFALLLSNVRRSGRALRVVAALMVFSEVVRTWWLVLPASGRRFGAVDLGCLLAAAGVALAAALRQARQEAAAHA